ncbi:exodeoxyribonuclease VII small subunit [bacterium]|nr:exodeoxyribonuclease VII small subunit [bacterium]
MSSKAKTEKSSFVEPKSFEQALERLQELVESLEAGDVSLEHSVGAFEEGQKLVQFCQAKLKEAETSLKKLIAETESLSQDDGDGDE